MGTHPIFESDFDCLTEMSGLNREKGLETSDTGALNEDQRAKLQQLKVDVQKLDEKYIREHPELDVIIYEFVREVLHRRPSDFNSFAADWFSNPKLKSHIDERIKNGNPSIDLDFVNDLDPMKL